MKIRKTGGVVALVIGCLGPSQVFGQSAVEPNPSLPPARVTFGTEMAVTSAAVWRGFVPVDAVSVQPLGWVKVGDVTMSSWTNVAPEQGAEALTEHDLTVDYSRAFAGWTVSGGWINYAFPTAASDRISNELYAGVGHAGLLNPTFKVYHDVQAGDGTYFNLATSHTLDVHGVAVTPNAAIGYNHHQWIDTSVFSDIALGVKLLVPTPVDRIFLTPFVTYTWSPNSELFPAKVFGGAGIVIK